MGAAPSNPTVTAQLMRAVTAMAIERAARAAHTGNFDEAFETVRSAIERVENYGASLPAAQKETCELFLSELKSAGQRIFELSKGDYAMLRDIASAHAQEVSTTFVSAYNTEDVDETCEDMHEQLGQSTSAAAWLNEQQGKLRLHRNFKQLMDQVSPAPPLPCPPRTHAHTTARARSSTHALTAARFRSARST
jgi:hypothetical protein